MSSLAFKKGFYHCWTYFFVSRGMFYSPFLVLKRESVFPGDEEANGAAQGQSELHCCRLQGPVALGLFHGKRVPALLTRRAHRINRAHQECPAQWLFQALGNFNGEHPLKWLVDIVSTKGFPILKVHIQIATVAGRIAW